MAIQNFIAGGFYGKLGSVVGQRWRNIRTVRTYVVGKDPKTPKQQANRAEFAESVRLAQIAMNMNKGAPAWFIESMPEFSYRVGTSRGRLRLGQGVPLSMPVYPNGYIPKYTSTNFSWSVWSGASVVRIISRPPAACYGRKYSAYALIRSLLTDEVQERFWTGIIPSNSQGIIDVPDSRAFYVTPEEYVVFCTNDDADYGGDALFVPNCRGDDPWHLYLIYDMYSITKRDFGTYLEIYFNNPNLPIENIEGPWIPGYAWNGSSLVYRPQMGQLFANSESGCYIVLPKVPGYTFDNGSALVGDEYDVARPFYTFEFLVDSDKWIDEIPDE